MGVLLSLVFIVAVGASAVVAPDKLPDSIRDWAPSIGWFITMINGWQSLSTVSACVVVAQSIAAFELYKRFGFKSRTVFRVVFNPLMASCAAAFSSLLFPRIGSFPAFLIGLIQLWSICGGLVMMLCFPVSVLSAISPQEERDRQRIKMEQYILSLGNTAVKRDLVGAASGILLDSAVIIRTPATKRWMLYSGGNGEFYENSLVDMNLLGHALNANVIMYNARGVGHSTGYVSHTSNLVEDAKVVLQHYIKVYSISPEHLLLFGHSIGGGVVAELGAKYFPSSPVVIDRSFSSLSDAAATFTSFSPAFTKTVFPLLVGDLALYNCWNQIHHSNKLALFAVRDEMINYSTSSLARKAQFSKGGTDFGKVVQLEASNPPSWHNSNLFSFSNKGEIIARIISLYPQD